MISHLRVFNYALACASLLAAYPLFAQLSFSKRVIDNSASGGFFLYAVDLDGDGDKDLLAATLNSGIKWYRNNGGSFTRINISTNFPDSWSIHAADLDGDGDLDIVACSGGSEDWTGPSEIAWWENDGAENFTKHTVDTESGHPHAVVAADLDDDGDNDIAWAAWKAGAIYWLKNNGTGSFTRQTLDGSFNSGHTLHVADMNLDGRVDLVAGGGGRTAWYRNNGGGSFTKNLVASGGAYGVYAADVNGDGSPDIVRGRRDNFDVDWLQGPGFTIRLIEAAWSEAWGVAAADLDGDGDTDIYAAAFAKNGGSTENRVSYFLNNGSQSFSESVIESGITRPKGVEIADFDRDGDPDLALITRQGNVIWYENTGSGGGPIATLTLTSPNGGENLAGGANHTITWTSTGDIANVKLEYSTNGGSSYTEIVASTPNDGSHSWTAPDVSTTTALVRVSDAADGSPADVSNSVFTITSTESLTLIAPNGGENFIAGASHNITWTSVGSFANVKLEYSLNSGGSYTTIIASTPNDGSFAWTVPNVSSTTALVRISDAADGNPSDVSNAVFSIIQGESLTLISPNGGETLTSGSVHTITWTATGSIANVKLEYSTDAGASYTEIIASTPNDGSHDWSVPQTATTQALVRVLDAVDGAPSDVSNSVFTILTESITVTSPSGGQVLTGGSTHQITWTSAGSIAAVRIEYSIDNGLEYTTIVASAPNTGSFNWTVPITNTTFGFVRVSDAADGAPSDVNDGPFTIVPPAESLTLSAPNGGEVWPGGSLQNIIWSSAGTISAVKLEYSTNAGGSWTEIVASAPNNGLFNWMVPSLNSNNTLVRISDADDGDPSDVSNNVFTIDTQSLTLISPNGGESLGSGNLHKITWTSTGQISSVKLEYSTNAGSTWILIDSGAPNTGSYDWVVPAITTSSALVRISDAADGAPADASNSVFSITISTLTLTSPNGGESWFVGSNQTITWSETGGIENVKLEYSTNNGASWTEIIHATPNDGSHPWSVPNSPTNQALLRISDASDGAPADISDAPFSIINSTLTLTSPNGGEMWTGESVKKITWTWSGSLNAIKLDYSVNNGTTWNAIVSSASNSGSYDWTLPDLSTSAALVRIANANGDSPSDVSNGVFTIIGSSLTVLAPNGGESWEGNSQQLISWSSTGVFPFVKIEYSLNAGASWTSIAGNVPNTGSYTWQVANIGSEQALVRISDAADALPMDASDNVFAITEVVVSVENKPGALPTEFGLSQNYPNPFNPQTKIDFAAPNAATVRLAIYNLRGELVRLLVDEEVAPGSYTTIWNGLDDAGRAVPSGVYVYRIQIGEWQASKKLLLVK